MGIPKLTREGALPPGIYRAPLAEVREVFGGRTHRRAELWMELENLVRRARRAKVSRILIDGSFVTAKKEPRDVDLLFRVDETFARKLTRGERDARWIADLARSKHPKPLDVFIAVDEDEWRSWIRFFQHDPWFGRKGVVELTL